MSFVIRRLNTDAILIHGFFARAFPHFEARFSGLTSHFPRPTESSLQEIAPECSGLQVPEECPLPVRLDQDSFPQSIPCEC